MIDYCWWAYNMSFFCIFFSCICIISFVCGPANLYADLENNLPSRSEVTVISPDDGQASRGHHFFFTVTKEILKLCI